MKSKLEELMESSETLETFLESTDEPTEEFADVDLEPMTPIAPEYVDHTRGNVKIVHGQHDTDYVWHISPANPRQHFKQGAERVIVSLAVEFDKAIGQMVELRIHKPLADWEIQEYTFKAIGLMDHWSITKEMIAKLNDRLFIVAESLL